MPGFTGRVKTAELQQRSLTQDAFGGQSVAWATIATIWCEITTSGGRELMAAQAQRAEVTHAVICRYRAEFADPVKAAAMRLMYQGRPFNILSVANEDERNQWVSLGCSEGMSNG
jgi:SPP1 family predicted phage head-tail adaptor